MYMTKSRDIFWGFIIIIIIIIIIISPIIKIAPDT